MDTMRAIVKGGSSVAVRSVPVPAVRAPDDVIIRVAVAGVCRTDLYVAAGRLPCPDSLVLGHEFAGTVHAVGSSASGISPGQRVAVMPIIPCLDCDECRTGAETVCQRRTMLGVDRDGAFAEFVAVPARAVYVVPDFVPFQAAAYAEPVAAALAVLNAGLRPGQRGLIYGRNRFAALALRILVAHDLTDVTIVDPAGPTPAENGYDFAIETDATADGLAAMLRAVRPRGTVVLKSRPAAPVPVDVGLAVRKELTFRAVHYGSFREAVGLLAERRVELADLFGPAYPLEYFERVFAAAERDESLKLFFAPGGSAD